MNGWKRLIPFIAGVTITVAAVGILKSPTVSAAVRAALVEVAIPSNTFYANLRPSFGVYPSAGPDTGTLGVTNLLITNFNDTTQAVLIYAPIFAGGACGGTITGKGSPFMQVSVPPLQTLSIVYPTPLTFHGENGHTCIAAQSASGGEVEVDVNGFVN